MISEAVSLCLEQSITLSTILVLSCLVFLIKKSRIQKAPLPPGPRGLPIIGNIPFLDREIHSCLAKLSQRYGPVMKIRLGTKLCIVFSSPSVAKEVLKDYDTTFADRDRTPTMLASIYGSTHMAIANNDDEWRIGRKLCVRELVSHAKLVTYYDLRRREVREMVSQVYSKIGSPIDIGEQVTSTMFSIITSMMWGSTLDKEERTKITTEYTAVANQVVKLAGEPSISDIFPALAPLDLQGKQRKMTNLTMWFDNIYDRIIDQRRKMESMERDLKGSEGKDFLQILLQIIDKQDQKTPLTLKHMKTLFMDMTFAGTRSISTTVEWGMAELLKEPAAMREIKQELEDVVGMNNIVEETHLPKLPYLEAVAKEVLRLHPTGPLLLPRSSKESCVVGGYFIPKDSKIFVNAWAIQRDPKYWKDPLVFRPGRFLDSTKDWDYNGNDFRYFPFGSGRRNCVGTPIAERLVPYLLASLLHSFDWDLPVGVKIDSEETFEIELRKKIPLVAIPKPRLSDPKLYA